MAEITDTEMLNALREARGLADEQLARLFEVPGPTVRLWCRGGAMGEHHTRRLRLLHELSEDSEQGSANWFRLAQRALADRSWWERGVLPPVG